MAGGKKIKYGLNVFWYLQKKQGAQLVHSVRICLYKY